MSKCIGWGLSVCHNNKADGNVLYCSTCEGNRKAHEARLIEDGIEEGCHEYTDEITCPYCGYVDRNSGECPDEDDECICGDCGEVFQMVRNISVTYSTYRVKKEDDDCE